MEKCCTSTAAGVSHPLLGQLEGTPGTIGRHRQFAPAERRHESTEVAGNRQRGRALVVGPASPIPPKPPVLGRISEGAVKAAPSLFAPRARNARCFIWRWCSGSLKANQTPTSLIQANETASDASYCCERIRAEARAPGADSVADDLVRMEGHHSSVLL
jgi:hypothetical protein